MDERTANAIAAWEEGQFYVRSLIVAGFPVISLQAHDPEDIRILMDGFPMTEMVKNYGIPEKSGNVYSFKSNNPRITLSVVEIVNYEEDVNEDD